MPIATGSSKIVKSKAPARKGINISLTVSSGDWYLTEEFFSDICFASVS